MASSAAVHANPIASGPGTPRWTARSSDPESAFGGLSRGRGRGGGRGGPRGGRSGGRGGGRGGKSTTMSAESGAPSPKASSPTTDKSTASVPPKATPADSPKDTNPSTNKPKPGSRRGSRAVPSLVIASSTAESPTSGRSPNRRKRASTNGKSPASAGPKSAVDDTHLRPVSKARPIPPPAAAKDVPPHLRQGTDARSDIDALVERVRAVAMAENRPATPGTASHIDWAGDDDDTLPDLDDWGVTTTITHTTVDKPNEISPIFVDGLKPLPEPATPVVVADTLHPDARVTPKLPQGQVTDAKPVPAPRSPILSKESVDQGSLAASATPSVTIPRGKTPVQENGRSNRKARHPLPPKPIAVSDTPLSSSRLPPSATPMRGKFAKASPPDKAVSSVTVEPTTPMSGFDVPAIVKLPEQGQDQSASVDEHDSQPDTPPPPSTDAGAESLQSDDAASGLAASIHAPKPGDTLSASVYAPSPGESRSAPGSATFDSFKPAHTRAHTVGRPPFYNGPQRFSRSTATSPRGSAFVPHHARNHSSPPVGAPHRTHVSRPVITGDALSRLVRTIGTTVTPAARSQPVAVATKDQ
ncbi:hypothetical protein CCMSSC00406_0001606 [Pleurotus cornucopiae]|uniref:Uncharacterized protein n=1 Tax=Pleurotus cornucopiae TaxID=5321 RepID=A0ACB7IMW9_PLECO|nr:hypothetical protein CCMSSC00406_0001606 [Pleurotus cornucopiae]